MTDTNWQAWAACRGVDPELFFPEATDQTLGQVLDDGRGGAAASDSLVGRQVEAAKAVCRGCSVRERCLVEALERLPYGIAGGMTEQERRRARAQREHATVRAGRRKPRWLALLEAGSSPLEVAREYGVSARTIARWAARVPAELRAERPTRTAGGGAR
ncbi:WhiB family transcriptional regulator [Actinomycetospora lutea]|uniref:WhiB family transcriptional regulator n=1 Tax=Actinomycetospora lutea TaxID=663604 RepID=UPI003B670673